MPEVVRVCILGSGSFARVHARWWLVQPGVKLVAVASRDPESISSDPVWSHLDRITYEEAFQSRGRFDLLDVVTPSALHAAHSIRALQSGMHVLVEKPMATTFENAQQMLDVARANKRRLFVVSQYRFVPAYRVVSSSRASCRIRRARFEYTMPPEAAGFDRDSWKCDPALSGGGILFGSGIHLVDLLVHWFGEPDQVESRIEFEPSRHGIENFYEARWRGKNDESVEISSHVEEGASHRTTLELEFDRRGNTGSSGKNLLDRAVIVDRRVNAGASPLSWKARELALGLREKIVPWRRDPLGRQFADIVEALKTGRRAEVEGEDGLSALRTILRIRDAP